MSSTSQQPALQSKQQTAIKHWIQRGDDVHDFTAPGINAKPAARKQCNEGHGNYINPFRNQKPGCNQQYLQPECNISNSVTPTATPIVQLPPTAPSPPNPEAYVHVGSVSSSVGTRVGSHVVDAIHGIHTANQSE